MSVEIQELRRRAEERLSRLGHGSGPHVAVDAIASEHEQEVLYVELEMQKEELEASRDRYAAWFDGAPVGMALLDPRSRILSSNDTARVLLGFDGPFDGKVALARFLEPPAADQLQLALRHAGRRAALEVRVLPSASIARSCNVRLYSILPCAIRSTDLVRGSIRSHSER